MEKKIRKKRPPGASKRPAGVEREKTGTSIRPSISPKNEAASTSVHVRPTLKVMDIQLNPETARQAVILSEVIGKPVSKRGKRW